MHEQLSIGVVDQSSAGWTAASIYSRMILRSLTAVADADAVELYFLTSAQSSGEPPPAPVKTIESGSANYLPGERRVRKLLALGEKSGPLKGEARLRKLLKFGASDAFSVADKNGIDVLLPLLDVPPWPVTAKLIGWIPDFQHVYLPEFFSQAELDKRNATIERLARRANVIMVSSNAARSDFSSLAPNHTDKVRVVPFPSLLVFETLPADPESTRNKFRLQKKFALVANQFWGHKNHQIVVSAAAQLRDLGTEIPIVMTGLPSDPRDPANSNFSALLQAIAAAGLTRQITILGQVPYADLINLMSTAALIIQPSRFEGWSTIVQDAKALGRALMCSDIPVHREQAPGALGFFPADEPGMLSDLLRRHWDDLMAGPDPNHQSKALSAEREYADVHGRSLMTICREICG